MAAIVNLFSEFFVLPVLVTFFFFLLLQQSFMVDSARTKSTNALGTGRGFSLDLVHRDSPHSPLYDPSSTRSQRMVAAFKRSMGRHGYLSSRLQSSSSLSASSANGRRDGDIWSPVTQERNGGGDFVMRWSLGTPPHTYWSILDTGSDLIWTQCLPCLSCYNQTAPFFNPTKSSSYKTVDCGDALCSAIPMGQQSCDYDDYCGYTYSYGDNTKTDGTLSTETLTLVTTNGRIVKIPKIAFGCSHQASGLLGNSGTPGLVGLGAGPLSLVSQLGTSIGYKFAYCLVQIQSNKTGSLKFGNSAKFSGAGKVQSTPMKPSYSGTNYLLTLHDISVADKKLNITQAASAAADRVVDQEDGAAAAAAAAGAGGGRGSGTPLVIDSGTVLTYLDPKIIATLDAALVAAVKSYRRVPPPENVRDFINLCFRVEDSGEAFPDLVFHFEGGADWRLTPNRYMIELQEGVSCFTIIPTRLANAVNIFGHMAQANYHVEHDLENALLSFVPTDCNGS